MKAIMKPIKPETCANIMNNKQSILVIKNEKEATAIKKLIDEYGYADIYVYCSKSNTQYLVGSKNKVCEILTKSADATFSPNIDKYTGNGKVVFKFRCYNVEEIVWQRVFEQYPFHYLEEESGYGTKTLNTNEFKRKTCLTDEELEQYLNTDESNKHAYAIHISDLEIFDEPKELSEFRKPNTPSYEQTKPFAEIFSKSYTQEEYKKQCERFGFVLTKAPKNFCYVEVE